MICSLQLLTKRRLCLSVEIKPQALLSMVLDTPALSALWYNYPQFCPKVLLGFLKDILTYSLRKWVGRDIVQKTKWYSLSTVKGRGIAWAPQELRTHAPVNGLQSTLSGCNRHSSIVLVFMTQGSLLCSHIVRGRIRLVGLGRVCDFGSQWVVVVLCLPHPLVLVYLVKASVFLL